MTEQELRDIEKEKMKKQELEDKRSDISLNDVKGKISLID